MSGLTNRPENDRQNDSLSDWRGTTPQIFPNRIFNKLTQSTATLRGLTLRQIQQRIIE
jgi:hypothetical protein